VGRLRINLRPQVWGGILIIVFGILVGTGFFTFVYARGTSYFSDDPNTCLNCHVMRDQFDAWSHSSHSRVATCNDCHTPHEFPDKWIVKAINGFNHSVAFTLGGFHEPIRINDFNAQVVQNNCVGCHQRIVNEIYTLHASEPLQCVSCHSNVGHRTRD
jgi:cytochrome c nitrite reductase small subunit